MSASSKKKLRKEQNAAALTEKQRKQQSEAKKLKLTSTIFVVVMAVVLLAAVSIMIVSGIRSSGIIEKNTIALTVGNHEVNTVMMNYYYTDTVSQTFNEWNSQYGDYADYYFSMMGLDPTVPLNEQNYYGEEGITWADNFMDQTVEQVKDTYALYDQAIANGYTLTEDDLANIDSNISMMGMYASLSGRDTDEYLALYYGSGADEESLREYLEVITVASSYFNSYEANLNYDDAAIRAYEAGKYQNYNSYTYSSCYLSYSSFLDEAASEDPTDAQVDAALAEAKAAAESLLTATNIDELNAAIDALEVNADSSTISAYTYDNSLYTSIAASLQDWVTDEARQENDITMIPYETVAEHEHDEETEHEHEYVTEGYYVVLFHSSTENTEPMGNVRHLLVKFEQDEAGNVSDESKASAKAEADGYLKTWQDGEATEESFIALVQEHSDDTSASTGGLFEDINPASSYVENFLNWSIDPNRVAGDAEVIETEYGYHVMYYVGDDELSYRDYMIIEEMTTEDLENWYNGITEAIAVVEGDLSKVNTALVLAAG